MNTTGPVLTAGGITVFNQLVMAGRPLDTALPIVVGTGIAAGMFALLEKAFPKPAVAIAWLALVTVLFTRINKETPSPFEAFQKWIGS